MEIENIKELKKLILDEAGTNLLTGDDELLKLERIPTGIYTFDKILNGGIPRRRYTMFWGSDSSGKSTLAALCIKAVQSQGGVAAYIDGENTYDPEWWKLLGVKTSDLLYIQTHLAEKLIDTVRELCKNKIDLIVLDSIASLVPGEEYEKDADKKSISVLARLVNTFLKKIVQYNEKSAIILINQFRMSIGGYIPEKVLPGGLGQRFMASLICEISKGDPIFSDQKKKNTKKREESIGYYMDIYISKSKVGSPYKRCSIPIYFDGHIDLLYDIIEKAIERGIIERSGPSYSFDDQKFVGKHSILEKAHEDGEFLQKILKEI